MALVGRIVLACIVAFLVYLALVFLLGPFLLTVAFAPLQILGGFFVAWGYALAIVAGLWYFFAGPAVGPLGRRE